MDICDRPTTLAPTSRASLLIIAAVLASLALMFTAPLDAHASGVATWRSAPALAPSPPSGVNPAPYPVPLGIVGQISFWEPNRGLLITGGTQPEGPIASGLYAYDGRGWHQLSTVCGGALGRIAWAGPDEFWTIADQRAGQIAVGNGLTLTSLSLCHFLNGVVVGSYAMPLGQPDSYLEMDAAACLSPADCWFAGKDGGGGAFHLHWDGAAVSAVDDPEDHAVTGMANFQGKLYEGLAVGREDSYLPNEQATHPAVIRSIVPAPPCSSGAQSVFCEVFLFSAGQSLPEYSPGLAPDSLGGFDVASDGSPLGAGATQIWAAADPPGPETSGSHAPVTILHYAPSGGWTQVLPAPGGGSALGAHYLSGSATDRQTSQASPAGNAIAPEPGTTSAWLSLASGGSGSALLALLQADGTLVKTESLPGPEDPVGFQGAAGPIACAAIDDCWMATNPEGRASGGWLFHLTDGVSSSPYPPDTDPIFTGALPVIGSRPPDNGVPVIPPDLPPVDDSLANQQQEAAQTKPPEPTPAARIRHKKHKPLVLHIKSRFLHRRELVISFTLTARAHVQLIGRRGGKVVAQTTNQLLRPGGHQLSLNLDPARWPSKLQFKATPIGVQPPAGGSGGAGSNTVGT